MARGGDVEPGCRLVVALLMLEWVQLFVGPTDLDLSGYRCARHAVPNLLPGIPARCAL